MIFSRACSSVSTGALGQRKCSSSRGLLLKSQGQSGVIAASPHADGVEVASFCDEIARRTGGGLLIDFFDQAALNKLTRDFGHAGMGASWLCSAI